jgi:hypothetical protein
MSHGRAVALSTSRQRMMCGINEGVTIYDEPTNVAVGTKKYGTISPKLQFHCYGCFVRK